MTRLCGRQKSNGDPCTQEAGHGTDHPGRGACHHHEGKAIGLVGQATRMGLATPVSVSPTQAITGVLHLAAGELAYVSAKVAELGEDEVWHRNKDGEETTKLNKYVEWRLRLMDKVARYAATAVGMGVAERQVRVAEAQTAMMGQLLEAVVGDVGLTKAQRKKLGPAIRKHMATLEAEAREVE